MPNWVRTRLTFNGEKNRVAEIKELVKTTGKDDEESGYTNEFDFNKVVPMPEELDIASSSSGECGMRYLILKDKHLISWTDDDRSFMERMEKQKEENPDSFNEDIELGKKYLSNILLMKSISYILIINILETIMGCQIFPEKIDE